MSNSHTPTPWECYPIPNRAPFYGLRKVGHERNMAEIVDTFMDTAVLSKDDAAYIVKAVNCHAELVDALDFIIRQASIDLPESNLALQIAKAALAKAGAA